MLDITRGGIRSWVFRDRLNGKREKVVISRYPAIRLKEARKKRDKLAAKVRDGDTKYAAYAGV